MELLAPAGTMENFMAALDAGADAIYLGGKQFNARANAANFDIEELAEAVRMAHILQVSVYVTVNILVGDTELQALRAYLQELERIGVDAIIVQDLAVALAAKEVAPSLHIHGSTQLTAATLDAVRFYEKLGFTRVVLARELSLDEIRHICQHCKAEIEVFVHGALCVSYSGQCLMSSLIGGRSGNRGACAQPCRLSYDLIGDGQVLQQFDPYLLSTKDLNYSEHVEALRDAGVASLKVEGRMKKVSYVKQVIGTYRHILDMGRVTDEDALNLQYCFNRGYSMAYLEDTVGKNMMSSVVPNNQGTLLKDENNRGLQDFERKHAVSMTLLNATNHTELVITMGDESVTVVNHFVPVLADKKPTSVEQVTKQLGRLGNTLFTLTSVQVPEGTWMWPSSVLNQLRRDGITALEERLIEKHIATHHIDITSDLSALQVERHVYDTGPLLSVVVDTQEGIDGAIRGGAQQVVLAGDRLQRQPYPAGLYQIFVNQCKMHNVRSVIATPRIIKDDEVEAYVQTLRHIVTANPDAIAIHVPQALLWLKDLDYTGAIHADTGLNIFNSVSANFWEQLGVSAIAPSQELTMQQLKLIARHISVPLEVLVHGTVEMMISEFCVLASTVGSGEKKNCSGPCMKHHYALQDKKGFTFPIRTDPYCRMHIMNSMDLDMQPYVMDLLKRRIGILRIDGRQRNEKAVYSIVKQYKNIMEGNKVVTKDEQQRVTRGHFFRGIL